MRSRSSCVAVLAAIAIASSALRARAQDQPADAGLAAPSEAPPPAAGEEPQRIEAQPGAPDDATEEPGEEPLPEPPPEEPDEAGPIPYVPPPGPAEPEPSIEQLEQEMEPTLVLPEWRIRIGGGVSLATSGTSGVWARLTQEAEWMPPSLGFIAFGIGAAEMIGAGVGVQVGARVGGYAWFCEDAVVRCMGAITIQLGVITGSFATNFDFSADADLRFLFSKLIELHVRGGFFSVEMQSFVDITGGLGVAF